MKRYAFFLGMILFSLVWIVSCTSTQGPQGEGQGTKPPKPFYTGTEFPDIVVPSSMTIDQNRSMIVRTQNYIGGVLYLKGRVTPKSVVEFFKRQLTSRGWKLTGSIIYRDILLAFNRPQGSCFVYVRESSLNTEVQIWASETIETGSLEPLSSTPMSP